MNNRIRLHIILNIFLFLSFSTLVPAQELKNSKNSELNEYFTVLKSDNITRHGEFKKFGTNNNLLIKGFYKNEVRDSLWEFYAMDKKLVHTYNYSTNELIEHIKKVSIDKKYQVIYGQDIIETTMARPPILLGGEDLLMNQIRNNIKYPFAAREKGISGTVIISFIIKKTGQTSNFKVKRGIGSGCDEEALRVVKKFTDNWLPGFYESEFVDIVYEFPVKFALQ